MPITRLAILTRDRPQMLLRCLTSCIQNVRTYKRDIRFLVLDDSPDAQAREATRQLLRGVSETRQVSISYAGLEEKRNFADALKRAVNGLGESIEFALFNPFGCGRTTGANRNAAFLAAAGECFLCLDDDTVCDIFAPLDQEQGLAFSSSMADMPLLAFADPEAALGSARKVDQDMIGLHERLLGNTVDSCMDAYLEHDVDMKLATPRFAKKLLSEEGRIRITWMGILGDSGFRYPTYLLRLQGKARERVVKDEATYRVVCRSRQILRVPKRLTIGGERGFLQSTALAFDNRGLLPPFIPVGRGQDGVFGALFLCCLAEDFIAYLPWAIRHDPQPPRENNPDDIRKEGPGQFHDLLRGLVLRCQMEVSAAGASDAERLAALGAYLAKTAGEELSDFADASRLAVRTLKQNAGPSLEKGLHRYHGTPRYWAADLKACMRSIKDAEESGDFGIPEDLKEGRTPEETWSLTRSLVMRFGKLLLDWPIIVEAAQRLKSEGVSLTSEIRHHPIKTDR